MVQNDTGPPVIFDVYEADGSKYTDMAGGSAKLKIKNPNTGLLTNTAHNDCVHVTGQPNQMQYNFAAGDIPDAGSYLCDLVIVDYLGVSQTAPEYVELRVRAENDG
jgi:hypothetical protein